MGSVTDIMNQFLHGVTVGMGHGVPVNDGGQVQGFFKGTLGLPMTAAARSLHNGLR